MRATSTGNDNYYMQLVRRYQQTPQVTPAHKAGANQAASANQVGFQQAVQAISSSSQAQEVQNTRHTKDASAAKGISTKTSATDSQAQEAATYGRFSDDELEQKRQALAKQQQQIEQEQEAIVRELAARDAEVRRHEQAHAAAGGELAGSPQYDYVEGPDGRQYAVSGEVDIQFSPVSGDPEATLRNAEKVMQAALAPEQPSSQDRRVHAEAQAVVSQARAEIARQRTEQQALHGRAGASFTFSGTPVESASANKQEDAGLPSIQFARKRPQSLQVASIRPAFPNDAYSPLGQILFSHLVGMSGARMPYPSGSLLNLSA
ncbi:SprA-related family protein [Allopseudospirillum japonicum]|uniref:SprA-related family protein n=1 Tax=Allopseudospirillum japonicum TaxID=64971 RepID=A0A1H6RSE6_9GAMM|nr:putative metalloprotease CJM1_0395 family protein [Allopseudospirillum japonicum]SEI57376.1 SprA-related family protein [Allopseudospirillum japonicum]